MSTIPAELYCKECEKARRAAVVQSGGRNHAVCLECAARILNTSQDAQLMSVQPKAVTALAQACKDVAVQAATSTAALATIIKHMP